MNESSSAAGSSPEHRCPHCGKTVATERGLKNHVTVIHRKHAEAGGGDNAPGRPTRAGRKSRAAGARLPGVGQAPLADDYAALFDAASEEIERQGEIVQACLTGLKTFLERAKNLRLAYMKSRGELQKLRALAQETFND